MVEVSYLNSLKQVEMANQFFISCGGRVPIGLLFHKALRSLQGPNSVI